MNKIKQIGLTAVVVATTAVGSAVADPVEFKVVSDWGSGYTAQLKLTNEGDAKMTDWRLSFDYDGDIKNLYSGRLVSGHDGHYVIEGSSWNKSLKPGQSVYLGWNGKKGGGDKLSNISFAGTEIDVPEGPYLVGYDLQADWGSGYVASISVANHGEEPIDQWQLSFDYPYGIDHIYNARIVSHEGDHYVIEGVDEGADLSRNEVSVFVIRGNEGGIKEQPKNIKLDY